MGSSARLDFLSKHIYTLYTDRHTQTSTAVHRLIDIICYIYDVFHFSSDIEESTAEAKCFQAVRPVRCPPVNTCYVLSPHSVEIF